MTIWIITDTHFGHDNMVDYCGRPVDFSEQILDNLKQIGIGGLLIHLGDFCIGRDDYWHERFNGNTLGIKKYLIKGNHDKKTNSWYLGHGWDFVGEFFSDHILGRYITFSHEPIAGIQNLNIHGHFHNNLPRLLEKKWAVEGEEERNREVLAGLNSNHKLLALEYTNYKAVLLKELLK